MGAGKSLLTGLASPAPGPAPPPWWPRNNGQTDRTQPQLRAGLEPECMRGRPGLHSNPGSPGCLGGPLGLRIPPHAPRREWARCGGYQHKPDSPHSRGGGCSLRFGTPTHFPDKKTEVQAGQQHVTGHGLGSWGLSKAGAWWRKERVRVHRCSVYSQHAARPGTNVYSAGGTHGCARACVCM